jgi:PPP family 3-phenylpropionic acid transporter
VSPRVRAGVAYFTMFAGFGAFYPYITLAYQLRGLDFSQIGLMISLGSGTGLLAAPAWGALSDRFGGSPRVLLASATFAVAAIAALAIAGDVVSIAAANVLLGIGFAGLSPIVDARALETAGAESAGYGPLRAWGSVGYVAASLGTGIVIEATSIEAMFPVIAACLAITAGIGLGLRPATIHHAERPFHATARIFRSRTLALFLVGAVLAWAAMAAVLAFIPLRFQELGASSWVIGLAAALAAGIEVPVMLQFPRLARRIRGDRLLVAGAAFLGLRSVLAAVATDPVFLVMASGIGGVGYALFLVGGVTYVADHVPAHLAATAQGIFQGVSISASQVVAAAVSGVLAGALGIQGLFVLAAAAGVGAVGIIALAARPAQGITD